jgi:DNA-binding NarL/FixJ family response regulator
MDSLKALILADFMFAARIVSALSQRGWTAGIVSSPIVVKVEIDASPPDLVIIELGAAAEPRIELIRQLREAEASKTIPVLAFGSHKARSVLQAARDAGASLVVSNGTLVSRFGEVLEKALQPAEVGERLMVEADEEEGNGE